MGSGCAGAKPLPQGRVDDPPISNPAEASPDPVRRVEMSPFYFEGNLGALDVYTDSDLFKRALDAYDMGAYQEAFNLYRKLIDKFPGSDYRILAFYNAGLALENAGEGTRALDYYFASRELVPASAPLRRDVEARLGAALERENRHGEAAEAYAWVLRSDLPEDERWSFEARMLTARAFDDDSPANLMGLSSFSERYTEYLRLNPQLDNQWLARARFSLGEIYFRRFRAVQLELPQEKLHKLLDEKAEELLRAQNQYMRTLQIRNAEWATAAVYRVGLVYEEFYYALNNAPVPEELDEAERRIYKEELRLATEPVRNKAIIAYDRIISFANELSIRTDWVERARDRVAQLRTMGRFGEVDDAAVR